MNLTNRYGDYLRGWPYGDCKIEKREIWTIPRLSKVPEAQCEILMIQSYEKNQNEWVF